MTLRQIHQFELLCDSQKSPHCQGTPQRHPQLNAYNVKHAIKLIRAAGWKVNDGKIKSAPKLICTPCRLQAHRR